MSPHSLPTTGPTTRFAPAPTGRLHLGHLANAIFVWGFARRAGARVVLRIEDHDRQRCRPEYEAALLDDLDRLGIAPDEPTTSDLRAGPSPFRQSENGSVYAAAVDALVGATDVYACDCSRATFAAWRETHGRAWAGAGCPGSCRERGLEARHDRGLRVALGDGEEAWTDALLGHRSGAVATDGDLLVRDRNGNWTYALCVVVDDLRHGVDLVVRGEDLVDATATQVRLGRLLGRIAPPAFAHHPLVRREDGSKLSKADGATAIGELLDTGASPAVLFGEAAFRVGLLTAPRAISFESALELVAATTT
ncbi:MAG TPA: glutamate--tRNA ligase family protein [Candidatus Limnocylindrales bacterium]|nr:glutamate--tRNA ligase family protein [Candidatus Limnocylindrales bacterium]